MVTIPYVKFVFGDLPKRLEKSGDEIPVPREMLTRLLDLYISCWDFDEEWYLATYPDIVEAVSQGLFLSAWAHFRTVGYLEGRLGSQPAVDAEWYVNTYPDIAEAMLAGKVTSAANHYVEFGYKEGRLPSDPAIHPRWYAPRYMPTVEPSSKNEDKFREHFLRAGYHEMAVPQPPR